MTEHISRPRSRYSQAALAAYLRGLGFESLILPGGLPKAAVEQSRSEGAPGTTEVAKAPQSGQRRPVEPPQSQPSQPLGESASFQFASDLTATARAEALSNVKEHSQSCSACVLSQKRNSVVFGKGNFDADLMLIGEGPGAQEDRRGEPFVGPAGELLSKMLAAIEYDRSDVYIANVVKCRPPGNRDPRPDEVVACSGYLKAQIELIRPKVILALGRVAAQALLQSSAPLGRLRNQWHEVHGVPVWVTYHPAALLRNASYKRPSWEDLQLVRDHLAETARVPEASGDD